ncbi:MAG: HAD hydrolase-like protein [Candidatus Moranbacteria bacterium]|jgi:FMN phosphatase YigB (HAD superfamily)|nr:HAD hydrolase-like protein [Candidatus Moranbacteria bacterium]
MIQAVVFDLGGVLIRDPWEWMLLRAEDNIADRFHLSRKDVARIGVELCGKYECSRWMHPLIEQEEAWWMDFLAALPEHPEELTVEYLIRETDRYIQPIEPERIRMTLERLLEKGMSLGICSNNVDFWFAKQWRRLELDRYFPEQRIILSQAIGATKRSPGHEMFYAVKRNLGCGFDSLLFIDDRMENLEAAAQCGIRGIRASDQSRETVDAWCSAVETVVLSES